MKKSLFTIILILSICNCSHKKLSGKNKFLFEKKYRTGIDYLNKGFFDYAQKEFHAALAIKKDSPKIYSLLGQSYLIVKKYDNALIEFNKAIKLNPDFAEPYFFKGNIYMLLKNWDMAISQYNIVSNFPFFKDPHNLFNSIGLAYYEKGNYMAAIENFNKSLEFKLDFPIAHYNLGLSYFQLDRTNYAITEFNRAIEYLPDYVNAYNQLGLIYLKNGNKKKAKENFNKVNNLAPKSTLAEQTKIYRDMLEKEK